MAELAGVSAGAQTHHFPHRVDLVAAAVEEVTMRRLDALAGAAHKLPEERGARVRAVLDLLWGDFSSDHFRIVVKLWVAAADDPDLYERLVPMERAIAHATAAALADVIGDELVAPDFPVRVMAAVSSLRGLALSLSFEPVERQREDPWPLVRPALERLLLAD